MIPLETTAEGDRGAGIASSPEQLQHHPQHHAQTTTSPASFPTNTLPSKSPKHHHSNNTPQQQHATSPPPLPYRSTSSTASATTPSNSGHSRNSRGSAKTASTASTSGNIVVSSYSSLASQSIAHGKYRQAYEYYQLALQDYLKEETTVVELVNAAATCFNLGALAKKLQEYTLRVHVHTEDEFW